jgi:hypothetical protein
MSDAIASSVLPPQLFNIHVITIERPVKPIENSIRAMVARAKVASGPVRANGPKKKGKCHKLQSAPRIRLSGYRRRLRFRPYLLRDEVQETSDSPR